MGKTSSANFSLKGWNIWKWVKGNWKTLKEIFKVGAPLLLGISFFKENPALIATTTGLGKLVLDTVEYYLKKY